MAAPVEIITELYRRFETGEDPFPLLDEQIVWEMPMMDTAYGHAGVAEFFRQWLGTWDDYSFKLTDIREAPDGRIVALFRETGHGRGSGVPVEIDAAAIVQVQGDKIVSYHGYRRPAEALADAGLQPA
jgi:ketosteroid isomerase-like protein